MGGVWLYVVSVLCVGVVFVLCLRECDVFVCCVV